MWEGVFSSDSAYLVTASSDTYCRLWDLSKGDTVSTRWYCSALHDFRTDHEVPSANAVRLVSFTLRAARCMLHVAWCVLYGTRCTFMMLHGVHSAFAVLFGALCVR